MTRHQLIAAPIVAVGLAIVLVMPPHELSHNSVNIQPAVAVTSASVAGAVPPTVADPDGPLPWMFTAVGLAVILLVALLIVIAIAVGLLLRRRRNTVHTPFD